MRTFKKIVAMVLILSLFNIMIPVDSYAYPEEKVTVRSGTPVILRLTEEVSSKTKNLNDQVFLEVARDVIIDGKVVIERGTPAIGTVTWIEKEGMLGKGGKVQFSVDSTKTVDGQAVLLRSTVTKMGEEKETMATALTIICCVLFLLMKGKPAVLPVGTEVKAYTNQDTTVTVR